MNIGTLYIYYVLTAVEELFKYADGNFIGTELMDLKIANRKIRTKR